MYTNSFWKTNEEYNRSSMSSESDNAQQNPLLELPFEIRMDLESCYFETGKSSLSQQFFLRVAEQREIVPFVQRIYFHAVKNNNHKLAWNIMVVLSQIPYAFLGETAAILALSATRNRYTDVVELGVRCYENWEDKNACLFLKQAVFSEEWLQEYADEVYTYVMEEGNSNVLFTKDYSWKMAVGGKNTTGDFGEYRSGYSCS